LPDGIKKSFRITSRKPETSSPARVAGRIAFGDDGNQQSCYRAGQRSSIEPVNDPILSKRLNLREGAQDRNLGTLACK
jgi:hypothetical protein